MNYEGELFRALEHNDDDDNIRVTIIRGAGMCFSSGYDLSGDINEGKPYHTAKGDGAWSRHVTEGWSKIADLAKPVISQVHGYAMANKAYSAEELDEQVLHRALEIMGARAVMRSGSELMALATHQESIKEFLKKFPGKHQESFR